MKNNSSLSELENLFSQNICVRDIAESLVSFDAEQSAEKVKEIMKANSYNVVGVRYNGEIKEYVESKKLRSGNIGEYSKPINHELNSGDSIKNLLYNLLENEYFFIKVFNKYGAIVTRSKIKKISFRLWFYGMIAILELNLLNLILSM